MIFLVRYQISGHSMEPVFTQNTSVLVTSIPYFFREPKIGDVIVLKSPRDKKPILKRIVKQVGNKYFVYGDNPKDSTDSTTFGPILKEMILGKVIFKFHNSL